VSARWVIGCDGMHSRVRDDAKIALSGASYERSFVRTDVHVDWPLARDEVSLFFSPEGLVVVAPLPGGLHRIVATVDDAPEHPSVPYMQALLDDRAHAQSQRRIHDSVWTSRFRVHTASPRTRARGGSCCARMRPTFTVRPAARA
jgi:2-polyprenyl-6-methoxyphenol hydroxylase-like FAD-dependent oxidoreductase